MARRKFEIKRLFEGAKKRAQNKAKRLREQFTNHKEFFSKLEALVRAWEINPDITVHLGLCYAEQNIQLNVYRKETDSELGWTAQCRFFGEVRELAGKRKETPEKYPCSYPTTSIGGRPGLDIHHQFIDTPVRLTLHNAPGPEEGDRCQIVKEMVEVTRLECKLVPVIQTPSQP